MCDKLDKRHEVRSFCEDDGYIVRHEENDHAKETLEVEVVR